MTINKNIYVKGTCLGGISMAPVIEAIVNVRVMAVAQLLNLLVKTLNYTRYLVYNPVPLQTAYEN
jgi:hypothetical protein